MKSRVVLPKTVRKALDRLPDEVVARILDRLAELETNPRPADVKTYERLREAEEDLADIRAYDAERPKVIADVKAGRTESLAEYRSRRLRAK